MLADKLIERAVRCTELQGLLDADPGHKSAGAWIAELSQKALNRREDRHVAIVRTVRRLRHKIELFESLPAGNPKRMQLPGLRAKCDELCNSPELLTKEDVLDG